MIKFNRQNLDICNQCIGFILNKFIIIFNIFKWDFGIILVVRSGYI
ncbi:MAG: hypothetical protein Q8755_00425 [Candidatus Phytoplasma australasiaticum]|nr:hypothetical protein [Sweet potato little leaf phytoplasma]MDV3152858.1 hypothetical protein [Candidatus Phytoplasma australasiaticum]QLL36646.1 hypothetical protein EPWB_v2c0100 ['Echinacea purpurea' witches'-broom phytoplasma]WEX20129.1 MAG: hypothetical protein TB2022_0120 [Candidatus Phytoplasma aurantifolia]MDV3142861.1 hypothetical protein [Sweet potato little leaf phytoplasma]